MNDWSGSGIELEKYTKYERKCEFLDGIGGAMKGKRCGQLSLGLLLQLGSIAREIWERIRFQI